MDSPTSLSGPRVRLCSNDDYLWERGAREIEARLNEAPQVFMSKQRLSVTYSCGALVAHLQAWHA